VIGGGKIAQSPDGLFFSSRPLTLLKVTLLLALL
jgi:hypothetical protein